MTAKEKKSSKLVWFKRDLRICDHAPLKLASESGAVLPLYIVEPELWQQPDRSLRQWLFLRDCLEELREDLKALGQTLIVRQGDAIQVLKALRKNHPFDQIFSHEETGTFWTRERDAAVGKWCKTQKIEWREFPSNGVVRGLQSRELWAQIRDGRMRADQIKAPTKLLGLETIEPGSIPRIPEPQLETRPFANCSIQRGGRKRGLETLKSFLDERSGRYNASISSPSLAPHHCSRLSAHLCYGTLSIREVEQPLTQKRKDLWLSDDPLVKPFRGSLASFQSRIAWRCHFTQKLEDEPLMETRCLHPDFEGMREPHFSEKRFAAWREGKTGFPLIDACMRWVHQRGWLTFRSRAMLASFAAYHLWLDWKKPSLFLAQMFTDYEPGIHYPQFQMQSGVTGINATRMYNPTKQACELDKTGDFIRANVPELAKVPTPWIHRPWELPANLEREFDCEVGRDYPLPIVESQSVLKFARAEIGRVRKTPGFRDKAAKIYDKLGSRKNSGQKSTKPKPKPKKGSHSKDQLQFNLL